MWRRIVSRCACPPSTSLRRSRARRITASAARKSSFRGIFETRSIRLEADHAHARARLYVTHAPAVLPPPTPMRHFNLRGLCCLPTSLSGDARLDLPPPHPPYPTGRPAIRLLTHCVSSFPSCHRPSEVRGYPRMIQSTWNLQSRSLGCSPQGYRRPQGPRTPYTVWLPFPQSMASP